MIYFSNGNLLSKSDISVVGIIFERQFFEVSFFFKKGDQWEIWYILSLIFRDVIFFSNWKLFWNIFSTTLQVIFFFLLIFYCRRREWLCPCWQDTVRSKRYTGQRLWGDCCVQVSFFCTMLCPQTLHKIL